MKKQSVTFNSVTSELAKKDVGKSESNIGDTREQFSKLCLMAYDNPEIFALMIRIGAKKSKKKIGTLKLINYTQLKKERDRKLIRKKN